MSFELKYPLVVLAVCFAAVFFAVKYYLYSEDPGRKTGIALFWLKYIFLSGTVLILFDPRITFRESEKILRKHLLLFDNSSSVKLGGQADTAAFASAARRFYGDPSFIFYKFGSSTDTLSSLEMLDFKDSFSSVSSKTAEYAIDRAVSKENAVSLTLFTDGNFTDANNFSLRPGVPVDIVYGSPTENEPDIFIKLIDHNDNPAPGSEKDFTVIIGYDGPESENDFILTAFENDRQIKKISGKVPAPGTLVSLKIELPEMRSDFREIVFSVTPLNGEKNIYNNKKSAVQRLLLSSSVLLIVSDTPSLDLLFFTKLLRYSGYSFDLYYSDDIDKIKDAGKYSALISFTLPVKGRSSGFEALAGKIRSKLFFTGGRTDMEALNRITRTGLKNFRYLKKEGIISEKFPDPGAFLLSRGPYRINPAKMPGIEYDRAFIPDQKNFEPLMNVKSDPDQPVLFLNARGETLTIIASFRSFWKLLFNDRDDNFASLMLNVIDRILVDSSSERIRISSSKPEYYSGERTVISGKLLDENLRPVKDGSAEVTVVENSLNTKLIFDGREWRAELYIPEPGVYTARITAGEGDNSLSKEIKFRILANDLETSRTGSDTLFLKSFAASRRGRIIPSDSALQVLERKKGKYDTVTKETSFGLTHNFWYFIMLAAVFIAELTLRKYSDLS